MNHVNPLSATGANMHQIPMLIELSVIERVKNEVNAHYKQHTVSCIYLAYKETRVDMESHCTEKGEMSLYRVLSIGRWSEWSKMIAIAEETVF